MTKSIYYNGGGIDNFAIEASCGGGRRAEGRLLLDLSLAQTQRMVPFYCTSDDFPCEDGSKTMFATTLLAVDTRRSASLRQTLKSFASTQ
jgi:hypothetical protein